MDDGGGEGGVAPEGSQALANKFQLRAKLTGNREKRGAGRATPGCIYSCRHPSATRNLNGLSHETKVVFTLCDWIEYY